MADADYAAVISLPCAAVGIRVLGDAISEICFLGAGTPARPADSPIAGKACDEIQAYIDNPARTIDIPLAVDGSDFQRRVWDAICRIPSGATRTYGDLATELGSTARAVGQACGDNRLPLAIPCHRVVAASGMGGFAHRTDSAMLNVKRWLLAHESRPLFTLTP
ncbi:MAG: methylated-DNA--[protein]-cysteine S-methyltransferase [Burkholderiaceae bacterium]